VVCVHVNVRGAARWRRTRVWRAASSSKRGKRPKNQEVGEWVRKDEQDVINYPLIAFHTAAAVFGSASSTLQCLLPTGRSRSSSGLFLSAVDGPQGVPVQSEEKRRRQVTMCEHSNNASKFWRNRTIKKGPV
jgi:hypothetical protein